MQPSICCLATDTLTTVMNNTADYRRCIWATGIVPTILALIVAAVMVIERQQVDWTASCSLVGVSEDVCGFQALFAWLPPIYIFSLAHIVGWSWVRRDHHASATLVDAAIRFVIFAIIPFIGFFGAYLFAIGVAGGFVIAMTVVGLIIAPFFGAVCAGAVSGMMLALAAGPPLLRTPWSVHRRRLKYYGLAGAMVGIIVPLGQAAADPAFGNLAGMQGPWLAALITLSIIAAASALMWIAGLRSAQETSSDAVLGGIFFPAAPIFASIALLSFLAHACVANETTIFGKADGVIKPIADHMRGYLPSGKSVLRLAGIAYTGPRERIIGRAIITRNRQIEEKQNVGTPQEVNVSYPNPVGFNEWRFRALQPHNQEYISVVDDQGGQQIELYCLSFKPGRLTCETSARAPRSDAEVTTQRHLGDMEGGDEAFELADGVTDAVLSFNYRRGNDVVWDPESARQRRYCRLILSNVTAAKFSTTQIIPCDADWPQEATRLRQDVEGLFR